MYNTLIALGAGLVAYLLGWLLAGWIAGFLPAILAISVVWALLARRSGQSLQALMTKAMEAMQNQKTDEARALLESGFALAKWQFLVEEQIHTQLGSIDYLEAAMLNLQRQPTTSKAALGRAREHFEKAAVGGWKSYLLGWQPRALFAVTLHRSGEPARALEVCATVAKTGRTDPLFWGLYVWLLLEAQKRDEALAAVGEGLKEHAKAQPLIEIQAALTNRKRPDMKVFGEAWYQFFPEEMVHDPKVIELARAQQERTQKKAPSQKTWPQPRR